MPRSCDKCKIKIIPGPTGPIGPIGITVIALNKRVLKSQSPGAATEPVPIINDGFSWATAAEPVDWPVAGNFIFFRAEMLETPGYAMGESFSVVSSLVYEDSVAITRNQLVIAHYRGDTLLAHHIAVSEIVGKEDYLIVQSIQDAVVGDFFYVALTPLIVNLLNFNFNLASLDTIPENNSFIIPADLPIIIDDNSRAGNYVATVTTLTRDVNVIFNITGGGGGGGSGGTSRNTSCSGEIGRGGAGGNVGLTFSFDESSPLRLTEGDILEWTIGSGGFSGQDGIASSILLNGSLIAGGSFGSNPAIGGRSGESGDEGGSSPDSTESTGGGGGAPIVHCKPGIPGKAGDATNSGEDGGINPRNGGDGGFNGGRGGTGGSTAGPARYYGSGGGGGGGTFSPETHLSGGDGGDGSECEKPANNGDDAIIPSTGGGGGGSAGLPKSGDVILGGNGGNGSAGYISILAVL